MRKSITITDVYQKLLDESGCKLKKTWADKAADFVKNHWNHGFKKC